MNEILATEIENTGKVHLILDIGYLKEINLEKEEIFCFFKKKNDFNKISLTDVESLTLNNKSKKPYSEVELLLLKRCFFNIKSFGIVKINDLEDFSIFYSFERIEKIRFQFELKNSFILSKYSCLKEANLYFSDKLESVFDCINLEKLHLDNYKIKSFNKFTQLTNLKELSIKQSSIKNLNGISVLGKLEKLELSYNRLIDCIDDIQKHSKLKELRIINCPKLVDFTVLKSLSNLEVLVLENVKELNDLDFIRNLTKLKSFHLMGNTNVIDGDLEWILNIKNLEELFIPIKKHYNISLKDLNSINL